MTKFARRTALLACALSPSMPAAAALYPANPGAISLASAYTQDFNTLASTGTSGTLPTGWQIFEGGANGDTSYAAGTGSGNTGNVYSFGAAGNSDRALGSLLSSNLTPIYFGAFFTNATGAAVTSLSVGYTGEEWRYGGSTARDQLTFQYSTDATAINSGTWTTVNALTFTTPDQPSAVGALDGNLALNRTMIASTIGGLSIASGNGFAIRYVDFDVAGSDDGLAVDDFTLTATPPTSAVPEPAGWATMIAGFAWVGAALRRRSALGRTARAA